MLGLILDSAARSTILAIVLFAALRLLRVRSPHVEMTVWTALLVGALAMPLLVALSPLTLPRGAIPWAETARAPAPTTGATAAQSEDEDGAPAARAPSASAPPARAPAHFETSRAALDWRGAATAAYLVVAAALFARIAFGLFLMERRRRRARPLRESCVGESDIRVSAEVSAPLTFGRTILLPTEWESWSGPQLRAVLAHERSHLAAGDFYVQALAGAHRAIFWPSPLSWWLTRRLAALAETISDNAAIEATGDRASYASILIAIASRARPAPMGVAMARRADVARRIDVILKEAKMARPLGWKAKSMIALALAPALALAAGAAAQNAPTPTPAPTAQAAPDLSAEDLARLEPYLGAYRLDPKFEPDTSVTLTRQDKHVLAEVTGWKPRQISLGSDGDVRFEGRPLHLRNRVFADGRLGSAELVWKDRYVAVQRIDEAEARRIADLYAQRLAEQSEPRKVATADTTLFDDYVGFYRLSDEKVFSVTREGDQLFNQTTGQRKFEIFPESDQKFFYTISAAQVNFERDADAHVVALVLHQGGRERRAPRISANSAASTNDAYKQRLAQEERPRTVAVVDPKSFDGYVGKYLLSPGVVMTATREGDRLFMQLSGQKKYELFPEGGREFFYTIVAAQITFVSDDQGRASKLVLHQNGWDMPAERMD